MPVVAPRPNLLRREPVIRFMVEPIERKKKGIHKARLVLDVQDGCNIATLRELGRIGEGVVNVRHKVLAEGADIVLDGALDLLTVGD